MHLQLIYNLTAFPRVTSSVSRYLEISTKWIRRFPKWYDRRVPAQFGSPCPKPIESGSVPLLGTPYVTDMYHGNLPTDIPQDFIIQLPQQPPFFNDKYQHPCASRSDFLVRVSHRHPRMIILTMRLTISAPCSNQAPKQF